jgi:hypothetical protein
MTRPRAAAPELAAAALVPTMGGAAIAGHDEKAAVITTAQTKPKRRPNSTVLRDSIVSPVISFAARLKVVSSFHSG